MSETCYLGFGTVKECPNMCKGKCGYFPCDDVPPIALKTTHIPDPLAAREAWAEAKVSK